jgi:hypothetical protein
MTTAWRISRDEKLDKNLGVECLHTHAHPPATAHYLFRIANGINTKCKLFLTNIACVEQELRDFKSIEGA